MSTSIQAADFAPMLAAIESCLGHSDVPNFLRDLHREGFMVVPIPPDLVKDAFMAWLSQAELKGHFVTAPEFVSSWRARFDRGLSVNDAVDEWRLETAPPPDQVAIAIEDGFAAWLAEVAKAGGKVDRTSNREIGEWHKYWRNGKSAADAVDLFEMPF